MPSRIPHLGIAIDLYRLGDQLNVHQVVSVIEVEQGDQTRVEEPEVLSR